MPGRICEHTPTVVAGLLLRLACSLREQRSFDQTQVVHLEIKMRLLWPLLPGPVRRLIVLHTLEPDEEPSRTAQAREVTVRAVGERQPCRLP